MYKAFCQGRWLKTQVDSAQLVSSESLVVRQRFQALHVWMLSRRLAETGLTGLVAAQGLQREYINARHALVFSFTDYLDSEVMAELARADRCLFYSLDDYFLYDFSQKPLSQIVSQDLLDEGKGTAQLERYIRSQREHLGSLSVQQILSGQVEYEEYETREEEEEDQES